MVRMLIVSALAIGLVAAPGTRAQDRPGKNDKRVKRIRDIQVLSDIDLKTTPLSDVLADLSKKANVTFVLGSQAAALKQAKATKLEKPKLPRQSLDAFLKAYMPALSVPNASYEIRPDYIEIRAEQKADALNPAGHIVDVLHNERINYEKDLQTTPFNEVIGDFAKKYDIPFIVDKTALGDAAAQLDTAKAEKLSLTSLNGLPLSTFLDVYLRALPLDAHITYLVRADHIAITSHEQASKVSGLQEAFEQAKVSKDAAKLVRAEARLKLPLVCIDAKERSLSAVLEDLRRVYGVNIVVPQGARENANSIITMRLLNVPIDTALEVLGPWKVIRKGNVFILTAEAGA